MHSHIMCICTRVAAAAEEVVYEVVAEPQGPQGQAPVHILLFQIMTPIYVLITCALSFETIWNSSCMIRKLS